MGQRYISILLRWSWILVVAAILAAGTTYWIAKDETPLYIAQTNLLVGPGIDSPNPDLNTLRAGGQLMQTYAELTTTGPFLQAVIDELKINKTPKELLQIIEIRSSEVTQILSIEVTHSRPELAISVANAIAENLVRVSPSNPESAASQLKDQIHNRVIFTEESIASAEVRIKAIEAEIANIQQQEDLLPGGIGTIGSITMAEARIKYFEVRLQTTADLEAKAQEGTKILEELQVETIQRIETLVTDLRNSPDFNIQKLTIAQLASERTHLSNLERTLQETQRLIGEKTLEELIIISKAKVTELEETLDITNNLDFQSVLLTQLQDERENLSELRSIEIDREGNILEQLAEERNRLSEMQQFDVERQIIKLTQLVERRNVLLTQLEEERRSIDDMRSLLPLMYASLLEPITNRVKIIEPVRTAVPAASWLWLKVLVSGAAGLIITGLLMISIEYLSDTIEMQNDLAKITGSPVLGVISRHRRVLNDDRTELVVITAPDSPAAEDYRSLSIKLLLAHKSNPIHSMVLASAEAKDDPTEIAENLAVVLSQTGKKVFLVDANLHDSNLQRYFDCEGKPDLAEILSDPSGDLDLYTREEYPNLSIIPTGVSPSKAFKLLTSARMKELITRLTDQGGMMIISAPAIMASADSLNLSSQVDGVVLVVYHSKSQRKNIQRTADSLKTVGVPLIGSILTNNHSRRPSGRSGRLRRSLANLSLGKVEEQIDSTKEPPDGLAEGVFTHEANDQGITLAASHGGGGKIRVPSLDTARESGSTGSQSTITEDGSILTPFPLVNINTANRKELEMLPGIGSVIAEVIIPYRESLGEFTRIEDIQKVTGIDPAVFRNIKNRITVTDAPALDQTKNHIRGSSLLLVGRIIAMGINFLVQVLTVRYLSKSDYGALAYALSVVSMAAMAALFGLDKAITRFIPIYHEQKDYKKMFGTVFMTISAITGIGVAMVLLAFALRGFITNSIVNDPLSVSLLLILIAMSPLDAMDSVFQGLLAVFAKPRSIFFRRHILGPSLKLAVVLLVIAARWSVYFLAAGYLLGGLLGIIVYAMMLASVLKETGLLRYLNLRGMKMPFREIFSFSVPLLSSDLVYIMRTSMMVVLLEHFRNTTNVAEFRAVVSVAGLNLLVMQSFKYLYTPLAARMFARNDQEGINKLYWQTAVWIAVISFPIFVLSFSLARPLTILLYGDRYADSGLLLAVLAIGNYFNAALGFNTYTLRVYGRVGYIILVDAITIIFSVGLALLLIPRYGALGAAISTSSTLVIYNLLNHTGLLLRTGIDLFQRRYLQVYLSITVSALVLFYIQEVLSPHFIVSILLAGVVSLVLVRFNSRVLDIVGMFPELGRLPFVRPLFGL